jgi:hypothetical protein
MWAESDIPAGPYTTWHDRGSFERGRLGDGVGGGRDPEGRFAMVNARGGHDASRRAQRPAAGPIPPPNCMCSPCWRRGVLITTWASSVAVIMTRELPHTLTTMPSVFDAPQIEAGATRSRVTAACG